MAESSGRLFHLHSATWRARARPARSFLRALSTLLGNRFVEVTWRDQILSEGGRGQGRNVQPDAP
jgi:hypothetical protein